MDIGFLLWGGLEEVWGGRWGYLEVGSGDGYILEGGQVIHDSFGRVFVLILSGYDLEGLVGYPFCQDSSDLL
jgi:hypothetical protein